MVHTSYTLTYDDYAAASREHTLTWAEERSREKRTPTWVLVTCAVVVALAIVFGAGLLSPIAPSTTQTPGGPVYNAGRVGHPFLSSLLVNFFPWAIVLLVFALVLNQRVSGAYRKLAWFWLAMFTLVALGLSGSSAWSELKAHASDGTGTANAPTSAFDALGAFAPLVAILALVVLFFRAFRKALTRTNWAGSQQLHGQLTLNADETALSITGPYHTVRYDWRAFVKFREGKDLFLLYPGDAAYFFVPKRAFEDGSQIESFRQLVETHVLNSTAAGAFSVVPLARVAGS